LGEEDGMDLWSALGVSREAVLIAAVVGLLVAVLVAGSIAFRRRRADREGGLGLGDG
jgi:ABC-type Fe3+ transport system permease subunit